MKRRELSLLVSGLVLIAAAAAVLAYLQGHQRLGQPGVKTTHMPGDGNLRVVLPETVLDYRSEFVPEVSAVTNTLPKDTSYGRRWYAGPDGFSLDLGVVLMGTDRTSMHKPQFCLSGQGWRIVKTEITSVPVASPYSYDLPVIRLTTAPRELVINGRQVMASGTFVYWFVADSALSADPLGLKRMWMTAKHLLTAGERHRWAYVTCFSPSNPGREDATFDRMKKFIAAAVPDFQLALPPRAASTVADRR